MTCDCCKDEIRRMYMQTDEVYKENRKLELEIEELKKRLDNEKDWNTYLIRKINNIENVCKMMKKDT